MAVEELYNHEITCPYCGYEYSESYDYGLDRDGDCTDMECPNCEKKFLASVDVTISYSTKALCEENNIKHIWEEFNYHSDFHNKRLKGKTCEVCGKTEFNKEGE